MRESNFRSVASNRAAVSITTTLYDRRALDCTADRPLVNSLNHLTYLTSSAGRVRETLCGDGGLERLIEILKSCQDHESLSKEARTLIAWKWTLAFQCLVFLGTRGTEQVRKRVVEAGVIPVISTVLDNFLIVMKRVKHQKLSTIALENAGFGIESQQQQMGGGDQHGNRAYINTANRNLVDTDSRSIMSVASLASSVSTISSISTIASDAGSGSMSASMNARYSARVPHAAAVPTSATSNATNSVTSDTNQDHIRPNTDRTTSANAASFAHNIIQQTVTPNILRSTLPNPPLLHSPASNAVFHAHARVNGFVNHENHDHHATQQPQPQATQNRNNFQRDQPTNNNYFNVADHGVNATHPATAQAFPTMQLNTHLSPPGATDPRATGILEQDPTRDVDNGNENPPTNVPAAFSTNNGITINAVSEVANRAAAARTSPTSSNTVPRCFSDSVVVPRDEDVVWALEILAFVSKYAYLKPQLQETHLVPQLSLRDQELPPLVKRGNEHVDCNHDEDEEMVFEYDVPQESVDFQNHVGAESKQSKQDNKWDYDTYSFASDADIDPEFSGEELNMFPLVERFTLKNFPREIQYWAGVVMRNFVRKDESKGGIRQCANFECGKWEEFPRQFAKCRRCKRTKYCSKDCQLKAWNLHRHWCLPPTGASASSGSSVSATSRHNASAASTAQSAPQQQNGVTRPAPAQQTLPPLQERHAQQSTTTSPTPVGHGATHDIY